MSDANGPSIHATRAIAAMASVAVITSVLTVMLLDSEPLLDQWSVPWPVFIPLYLAFSWFTLEFVRKGESTELVLTQLPLALALVTLPPLEHLAARLTASLLLCVLRRRPPLKASVNVASDLIEVAVAIAIVSALPMLDSPDSSLWLALLAALVLGELSSQAFLQTVLRLVGARPTAEQLTRLMGTSALTAATFASVSILTLAAAWTDPWTLLAVLGLAATLIQAYRLQRRRAAQEEITEELHSLVKDLGPLPHRGEELNGVLERVRQLMHARTLELDVLPGSETPHHKVVIEVGRSVREGVEPAEAPQVQEFSPERIRVPVVTGSALLGFLAVQSRLGDRSFSQADMRLLDTVAGELAAALDRGRMVADLRAAATRDPLTNLPNLRQSAIELDMLLHSGSVTMATLVVDSFREVNDTLGHRLGDELLLNVADRLVSAYPNALVGRLGGGRFMVAVYTDHAPEDLAMFGLDVRSRIEGDAQLGSLSTHVRLSVGCVRGPGHGSDAGTLMRRAETAMYSARANHGGPVIWEPAYEVQGHRRLAVVTALREAIASDAIGLAFQPKIDALTGAVVGVEALARWTHPALGSIAPDEFVPLAEASALLPGLTRSVLRQALTACHGWQRRGGQVGVAVNVSAETVLDPDFVTEVNEALCTSGIAPQLLTLELTEGVVVDNPTLAAERMRELRAMGVRLSVDDFGTGYSSLRYLKELPIDEVKIDKSFISSVVAEPADQAIIRSVVDIAHTLGVGVVAEGVEQTDQKALLAELGVDALQGFLFARPMPSLGMAAWIRRQDATSGDHPTLPTQNPRKGLR